CRNGCCRRARSRCRRTIRAAKSTIATSRSARCRLRSRSADMARPVTLFSGQWADLSLEELAGQAVDMGYDGLELACWGDHFDVERALGSADYLRGRWALLQARGLDCHAIANHLVGQAVCDRIDERHRAILPAEVWGDGEPEGVRQRAAARMTDTAKAARAFFDARPDAARLDFPAVVNG